MTIYRPTIDTLLEDSCKPQGLVRGSNEHTSRRIEHDWIATPTPLNPYLMRSACGRAYALKNAVHPGGQRRCGNCERKHPTVPAEPTL